MPECKCESCSPTPGLTYTEQYRHECEVRHVQNMPTRDRRIYYLLGPRGVKEQRGQEAARRIIRDLKQF